MPRLVVLTFVVLLLLTAPAIAKDHVLSWDNGTKANQQSASGTGHVIEFTAPKGKWWVKSVRVFGARYGGGYDPAATPFTVAVLDTSMGALGTTEPMYEKFQMGKFDWVDVKLDEPVRAPKNFRVCVAFAPTRTRGIYMGKAETSKSHSYFGLPGGAARPAGEKVEWMIRAVLTDKEPKATGDRIELALDDGEKKDQASLGGSAHVVEFRKPSGTWWVESVRVFGQRYGGGYDPATKRFRVTIAKTNMTAIHEEKGVYSKFGGTFAWAKTKLTSAVKAPSRFRVVVDFSPEATKGVYVGWSQSKRPASYTGLPGEKATKFPKGDWMIRVVLTKEKPALPDAKPPLKKKVDYLTDFAFLEKTVKTRYPALQKKGVDWTAVCREWRPKFKAAKSDKAHLLNVHRMLAVLGDSHTGVTTSKAGEHVPSFDGMYGAGMWIAEDDNRLILRALLPGHTLASKLPPGSELIEIDGRPAAEVHEGVRKRVRLWHGWSSTHFLDARLSFQFFLFGSKQILPATFRTPDGKTEKVMLPRWGPGGRGLSRQAVTMPKGIEPKGRAVSGRLTKEIGYVRILGGMNQETRAGFFAAMDALKGAKGIVLDCRGMGGGGDSAAWAMAGRFFSKKTPHGHVTLEPTGDWRFDGPVVMLIDERMISSAETFTWAMTETGRVLTVGRPTGGATIIPTSFRAPSGLFSFRMGVTDRKTPGKGVQPEGIGTAPDILVPHFPSLLRDGADPTLFIARDVLGRLRAGKKRDRIVAAWDEVLTDSPKSLADAARSVHILLK